MFDRFQILLGAYTYYMYNHEGQWSEGYARLCRISKVYTPGPMERFDLEAEGNEIALEVYNNLAEKHKTKPYSEIS